MCKGVVEVHSGANLLMRVWANIMKAAGGGRSGGGEVYKEMFTFTDSHTRSHAVRSNSHEFLRDTPPALPRDHHQSTVLGVLVGIKEIRRELKEIYTDFM